MLNAEFMDPLPPPLNLLTVPFWLLRFIVLLASFGQVCVVQHTHGAMRGSDPSRPQGCARTQVDLWPKEPPEKKGLVTWLSKWNRKVKHDEATAYVLQFVLSHENLAVESGKWRTRLLTRLGEGFSRVEQSVDVQVCRGLAEARGMRGAVYCTRTGRGPRMCFLAQRPLSSTRRAYVLNTGARGQRCRAATRARGGRPAREAP